MVTMTVFLAIYGLWVAAVVLLTAWLLTRKAR